MPDAFQFKNHFHIHYLFQTTQELRARILIIILKIRKLRLEE